VSLDVAIVGGGLGGLAAAACLARAGRRVAVFEQHDEPGGFATTFARGGYTFEVSLHHLDAVGPGEANRPLLEDLGVADTLPLHRSALVRRELWPAQDVDLWLPAGADACVATLAARFPGEEAGLAALFALAARVHVAAYGSWDEGAPPDAWEIARVRPHTAAAIVARYVADPVLRQIVGGLCNYLAMGPEACGALPFLVMLHGYHGIGAWRLRGGSRALTERLVGAITAAGGAVHLSTPVAKVLVRRGRAYGVTLADGAEVAAHDVVAAISPLTVFGSLVERAAAPEAWHARLAAMVPSGSFYRLSLGLDCDPTPGMAYETFLRGGPGDTTYAVTLPAVDDPGWGVGVIGVTAAAAVRDGPLPAEERARIVARLAGAVERHLLPDLAAHVRVTDLAHPGTYARYVGTPHALGFQASPAQTGSGGLRTTTPIDRLLLAGAWVSPGGGQTAAMISGRLAARAVLRGVA
jgi:phytoene dehydrogenase-like protein